MEDGSLAMLDYADLEAMYRAVGQEQLSAESVAQWLVTVLGAQPPARQLALEDVQRQEGRDHEVRHVDELADLEVDGHAADRVGLLAGPAAARRGGRSC